MYSHPHLVTVIYRCVFFCVSIARVIRWLPLRWMLGSRESVRSAAVLREKPRHWGFKTTILSVSNSLGSTNDYMYPQSSSNILNLFLWSLTSSHSPKAAGSRHGVDDETETDSVVSHRRERDRSRRKHSHEHSGTSYHLSLPWCFATFYVSEMLKCCGVCCGVLQ